MFAKIILTYLLAFVVIAIYGFVEIETTGTQYRWQVLGIWIAIGVILGLYKIWSA